jgi:hypothetical protein
MYASLALIKDPAHGKIIVWKQSVKKSQHSLCLAPRECKSEETNNMLGSWRRFLEGAPLPNSPSRSVGKGPFLVKG